MFDAIIAAIRAYIIRKLAEQVADDIVANGLTAEDQAIVDEALADPAQV